MVNDILILDTGQNLVGVYSVESRKYVPYRGRRIGIAIDRIEKAREIVTYNGNRYDLTELRNFKSSLGGSDLRIRGVHTDMREVCWSTRILGSNLYKTYSLHFPKTPCFPNTHEGSNRTDIYMTFKLWRLWKQGRLKALDGKQL